MVNPIDKKLNDISKNVKDGKTSMPEPDDIIDDLIFDKIKQHPYVKAYDHKEGYSPNDIIAMDVDELYELEKEYKFFWNREIVKNPIISNDERKAYTHTIEYINLVRMYKTKDAKDSQ